MYKLCCELSGAVRNGGGPISTDGCTWFNHVTISRSRHCIRC